MARQITIPDVSPLFAGEFYAEPTDAGIRAAAAEASAAGGGTVIIPPGTITLMSPLMLLSGVKYKGTGWAPSQIPGAAYSGTILQGAGTFPAFAYNTADGPSTGVANAVSYDAYVSFVAGMLRGCGVIDVSLYNFTHGVKCGAKYVAGPQYAEFRNINADTCGWGLWAENCQLSVISGINVLNPLATAGSGCIMIGASAASSDYTGNLILENCLCFIDNSKLQTRGICFWARDDGVNGTRLNDLIVRHLVSIRLTGATFEIIQAATMSGGSGTTINIVDGTQFAVDMPVTVDVTSTVFAANQIYFVISVAGNAIQLAATMGGAAIQTGTNANINIKSRGFPQLELVAYGQSQIGGVFSGLDIEGHSSTRILLQGVNNSAITFGYTDGFGTEYRGLTLRRSPYNLINVPMQITLDLDYGSASSVINAIIPEALPLPVVGGQFGVTGLGVRSAYTNITPMGGKYQNPAAFLYLSGAVRPDIYVNSATGGVGWASSITFDQYVFSHSEAVVLTNWGQYAIFVAGDIHGAPLPMINANNAGWTITVNNPQNAPVPLTPQPGQRNINNASSFSAPVTMTNGNPTITVPDGSKFPVNSVVWVSATQNGFTGATDYYVVNSAATSVKLASSFGGTPIAPSGTAAVNLILQSALVPANSTAIFIACDWGGTLYWAQK